MHCTVEFVVFPVFSAGTQFSVPAEAICQVVYASLTKISSFKSSNPANLQSALSYIALGLFKNYNTAKNFPSFSLGFTLGLGLISPRHLFFGLHAQIFFENNFLTSAPAAC